MQGNVSRRGALGLLAAGLLPLLPGVAGAQTVAQGMRADGSVTLKYDDADWHAEGDFPGDLPEQAGATHIAMFVAWAMLNGLAGEVHAEEYGDDLDDLDALRIRSLTPGQWFLSTCDGKFLNDDLTLEGNAFAAAYYGMADTSYGAPGSYMADYARLFGSASTIYHVPDSWETYARLEPVIAERFAAWRKGRP